MNLDIAGKTAVITGGSSGLGAACVDAFAAEGARVIFTGRSSERGEAFCAEARSRHPSAVISFCRSDAGCEADIAALAEAVMEAGGADFLINNAGILEGGTIDDTSLSQWESVQRVNVTGPFLLSRALVPQMRSRGGGAIVNVSSVSGNYGDYGVVAYNASKGAVANMTRAMALDLIGDNIRVNAVCPGSMRTRMYEGVADAIGRERCEGLFSDRYPMGRIAEPAEVASAVVFLCSAAASFINGVNLPVDGGLSAHSNQPDFS